MKLPLLSLLFFMSPAGTDTAPLTVLSVPERPEGITTGPGSTVFVSQILSGKVLQIDVLTNETKETVPNQTDREAWGLWYHADAEKLFVAGGGPSYGGGTAELYVYDAVTGEFIVACQPVSLSNFGSFMNDVTVRDGVAYATDSINGKLMAVDVAGALNGTCDVWEIDLPDNFDPAVQDDFGANGVVEYADGLLVAHEFDGSVWYIFNLGRDSNATFQEVIPDGGAAWADGLTVKDSMLYITQNVENLIGVFELSNEGGFIRADFVKNLTSPEFDTPATSAIQQNVIYSTNSRFIELPEISEPANDTVIGISLSDTYDMTSGAFVSRVPMALVPMALYATLFVL